MRTGKQPLGDFLRTQQQQQQQISRNSYSSLADVVSGVSIDVRLREAEEKSLKTFQEEKCRQQPRKEEETCQILEQIAEAQRREEASWQAVVSKRHR